MKYANLTLVVLLFISNQAQGYESNQTGIVVNGKAYEKVAPDMLSFTIGVKTHGKALDDVLASNLASANGVLQALSKHSILENDIKTSQQSFDKHRRKVRQDGQNVEIHDGFDATTQIDVILRDFSHYEALLKTLVKDPDVSLDGLKFEVSHAKDIRLRLIEKAYQDARRKAEILAGASGVALGKTRFMDLYLRDSGDFGGSNFSIEEDSGLMPGQISIGVSIETVFEIE